MQITDLQVELRRRCDAAGSMRAFSRQIGVSVELIRLILAGRRRPAGKVLDALGYERTVDYRRVETQTPPPS